MSCLIRPRVPLYSAGLLCTRSPPLPTPPGSFRFCFFSALLHPVDSGQQFVLWDLFDSRRRRRRRVFTHRLWICFSGGAPDQNQRGGSAEAPVGLELEMETLALLFHSLWILQCNTVSADSIIHIGKRRRGGGRRRRGGSARWVCEQISTSQVELWQVRNTRVPTSVTRQLIIIPTQDEEADCCIQTPAHAAQPGTSARKVLRRAAIPPSSPPSFSSSARRGCLEVFGFIHPSILPSLRPPPPFPPSHVPSSKPELSVGRE